MKKITARMMTRANRAEAVTAINALEFRFCRFVSCCNQRFAKRLALCNSLDNRHSLPKLPVDRGGYERDDKQKIRQRDTSCLWVSSIYHAGNEREIVRSFGDPSPTTNG